MKKEIILELKEKFGVIDEDIPFHIKWVELTRIIEMAEDKASQIEPLVMRFLAKEKQVTATKKSLIEMRSRKKRIAKGLCANCGEPRINAQWCEACREYYRAASRNVYRRKHNIPINKPVNVSQKHV